MKEEITSITILDWESILNEKHDMFQYQVKARVDYMTSHSSSFTLFSYSSEETLKGYTMSNTLDSIKDELARITKCEKEWILGE